MRGEDSSRGAYGVPFLETPPHAWGRPLGLYVETDTIRNTPTCVGKTWGPSCQVPECRKHPHMRGEDLVDLVGVLLMLETPPHAWGRPALTA